MTRNKFSEHKTFAEKQRAYTADCVKSQQQVMARYSDGHTVPLTDVDMSDVEFIGGAWRVQDAFPHQIYKIRDKEFILQQRLPRQEHNHFDFYYATPVSWNCYGAFATGGNYSRFIVAKYETRQGTYWSYGRTIEQARAFLGIKLYDEYKDLIHSVLCENCNVRNVK